jgi:ABC-type multidrug transport system fused ATPase/permease subunit
VRRRLPLADPGTPDLRSPGRFLLRVAALQRGTLALGVTFGVLWMGCQALVPFVIGHAIDAGLTRGDAGALRTWAAVLVGVGAIQAVSGTLRHKYAVLSWGMGCFRTEQWVVRQVARLGGSLGAATSTGEVVSIAATDATAIGRTLDITARGSGAVVSFGLVALLLLRASPALGLVVILGVPAFTLLLGPLLKPLHGRQARQRAALGDLTALGADTAAGLRVLRGIGGEDAFVARYREESQRVRVAGVSVARTQSLLDAAQVLVPGSFVVVVTWLGARFAVSGRITAGELVAFYGYAAFLVTPLRTITEALDKVTRALVAARRLITFLSLAPVLAEPASPAEEPPYGVPLVDGPSGLVVSPGLLTAVVSADAQDATELTERLGRWTDADVTLGGVPLSRLPLRVVRRRVVVADKNPTLFTGTLRSEIASDSDVEALVHAADAGDVVDALPGGLDATLEERGRTLSGGQRQRLVLARALATGADVLVLDEPTSAVDAHTEARIADRLRAARSGRATVVCTTSPLLLDRADVVALLHEGRVVASGTHRSLLAGSPLYRSVVIRGDA